MKKVLTLFISLCILLCFTACNKDNVNSNIIDDISQIELTDSASSQDELSNNDGIDSIDNNSHNSGSTTDSKIPSSSEELPSQSNSSNNSDTPQSNSSSSFDNTYAPPSQPDISEEKVVLPAIIDTYQEEYRPYYLLGNCRNLKGNPLVVLLFIDDDESNWSAKEVTEYTDKYVKEGLTYLEDKAAEWGVGLNFTIKSYSTPLSDYTLRYEGSVIKDLRVNGSSKDVLDQAAYDMGYSSNWELYSKFKTEHNGNDDVIFLTFINKAGKSYTRHDISTGRSSYSEHCVIFSDYLEGDSFGCRASTVAHELLHLFGAEDFYNGFRQVLAYQEYPKDIMLWMPTEAYENEIGDFTAYTIGWTDTIPQICYNEYWWK